MKFIDLKTEKPPINTKVWLYRFEETDCGFCNIWMSTGWMLSSGIFSVKEVKYLTKDNSIPTHWLAIENQTKI